MIEHSDITSKDVEILLSSKSISNEFNQLSIKAFFWPGFWLYIDKDKELRKKIWKSGKNTWKYGNYMFGVAKTAKAISKTKDSVNQFDLNYNKMMDEMNLANGLPNGKHHPDAFSDAETSYKDMFRSARDIPTEAGKRVLGTAGVLPNPLPRRPGN